MSFCRVRASGKDDQRRQTKRVCDYSKEFLQKCQPPPNISYGGSSDLYMKKLVLLSAIVIGAATASQAGVNLHIGFNLPLPPLPGVVISHPAPVYSGPAVISAPASCEPVAPACDQPVLAPAPACDPATVVVAPAPACPPSVVVAAPPVIVERPAPVIVRSAPHYDGRWDRRDRAVAYNSYDHRSYGHDVRHDVRNYRR
jgi:hypothetical protein